MMMEAASKICLYTIAWFHKYSLPSAAAVRNIFTHTDDINVPLQEVVWCGHVHRHWMPRFHTALISAIIMEIID
jgi:hypothetical protein